MTYIVECDIPSRNIVPIIETLINHFGEVSLGWWAKYGLDADRWNWDWKDYNNPTTIYVFFKDEEDATFAKLILP